MCLCFFFVIASVYFFAHTLEHAVLDADAVSCKPRVQRSTQYACVFNTRLVWYCRGQHRKPLICWARTRVSSRARERACAPCVMAKIHVERCNVTHLYATATVETINYCSRCMRYGAATHNNKKTASGDIFARFRTHRTWRRNCSEMGVFWCDMYVNKLSVCLQLNTYYSWLWIRVCVLVISGDDTARSLASLVFDL